MKILFNSFLCSLIIYLGFIINFNFFNVGDKSNYHNYFSFIVVLIFLQLLLKVNENKKYVSQLIFSLKFCLATSTFYLILYTFYINIIDPNYIIIKFNNIGLELKNNDFDKIEINNFLNSLKSLNKYHIDELGAFFLLLIEGLSISLVLASINSSKNEKL